MRIRTVMIAVSVSAVIAWQATAIAGQAPAGYSGQLPPGYKLPPVMPATPMDTSTKPWTGKLLPDGQPDVQGGQWRPPLGGTARLDNPWNGGQTDYYKNLRPSRIIDPPDGRVPYQPWALARQVQEEQDVFEPSRPEHLDSLARCLPYGFPRFYYALTNFRIVQKPGMVVFIFDRYSQYRVVRVDGAPPLASNVKLWQGDARGHWEGNTLLVENLNYNGKHRLTSSGDFLTENAKIKERFVFMDADNMIYEATIDDPTVFTRPWTMRVAQKRSMPKGSDAEFWEDACWEGNAERPMPIDTRIKENNAR